MNTTKHKLQLSVAPFPLMLLMLFWNSNKVTVNIMKHNVQSCLPPLWHHFRVDGPCLSFSFSAVDTFTILEPVTASVANLSPVLDVSFEPL